MHVNLLQLLKLSKKVTYTYTRQLSIWVIIGRVKESFDLRVVLRNLYAKFGNCHFCSCGELDVHTDIIHVLN